ncbi:hypothetical protein BDA99DRAFT_506621 [Phascolomyces articulosus]|uniref:Uncharacterized protein n=1 Tax=Phascolomyces articulosus TaxID=60185 RepID=A0AAD5PFM9_9FUNG|nr:hypothetical protein BDA99DRAFT_506621 [Phascolomyces articulosus]
MAKMVCLSFFQTQLIIMFIIIFLFLLLRNFRYCGNVFFFCCCATPLLLFFWCLCWFLSRSWYVYCFCYLNDWYNKVMMLWNLFHHHRFLLLYTRGLICSV